MRRFVAEELDFEWGGWGPGATYDHLHKMMLYGDPSLRIGGLRSPVENAAPALRA